MQEDFCLDYQIYGVQQRNLDINYRSTRAIVEAGNALRVGNSNLRAAATTIDNHQVSFTEYGKAESAANGIWQQIQYLHAHGIPHHLIHTVHCVSLECVISRVLMHKVGSAVTQTWL